MTKYKKENCREDGKHIYTNLMTKQTKVFKSLIKRRNNGEIVITVGYNNKRLCISLFESDREKGEVHTKGAITVWWP